MDGADPFKTHGALLVDTVRGAFSGNRALQLKGFQNPATRLGGARVPGTPVGDWHVPTVGAAARELINVKGLTQVRLRFAKDDRDNKKADCSGICSGNAPAGYRPVMEIAYSVP